MRKILLLLSVLIACSGCVLESVNPFYISDFVIQMPELNGQWCEVKTEVNKDTVDSCWFIENENIWFVNSDGTKEPQKITFFKVEDSIFVDIYPQDKDLKGENHDLLENGSKAAHSLYKIEKQGKDLALIMPNDNWLDAEVKAGRIKLSLLEVQTNSEELYDVTSQDWFDFLKRYKDDVNLFSPDKKTIFKKR